jgi:hypothetical protein
MSDSGVTPHYPARLVVDYPEGPHDRQSVFLRLILVFPMLVLLGLISGGYYESAHDVSGEDEGIVSRFDGGEDRGEARSALKVGTGVGGILFLPTLSTLLFARRYPRWWFDWHLALARFEMRVFGFLLLLRDEYPALEEE